MWFQGCNVPLLATSIAQEKERREYCNSKTTFMAKYILQILLVLELCPPRVDFIHQYCDNTCKITLEYRYQNTIKNAAVQTPFSSAGF